MLAMFMWKPEDNGYEIRILIIEFKLDKNLHNIVIGPWDRSEEKKFR